MCAQNAGEASVLSVENICQMKQGNTAQSVEHQFRTPRNEPEMSSEELSFPHELKVKTKDKFWFEVLVLKKYRCDYTVREEGDFTILTVKKCKGPVCDFPLHWWWW